MYRLVLLIELTEDHLGQEVTAAGRLIEEVQVVFSRDWANLLVMAKVVDILASLPWLPPLHGVKSL